MSKSCNLHPDAVTKLSDHWIVEYFRVNYDWDEFAYQYIQDNMDCLNFDEFIWTCLEEWYYQCPSVTDRTTSDKALELIEALPLRYTIDSALYNDQRQGYIEALNLECDCEDSLDCNCRDIEMWIDDDYYDFVQECISEANPFDCNLLEMDHEELADALGKEYDNV